MVQHYNISSFNEGRLDPIHPKNKQHAEQDDDNDVVPGMNMTLDNLIHLCLAILIIGIIVFFIIFCFVKWGIHKYRRARQDQIIAQGAESHKHLLKSDKDESSEGKEKREIFIRPPGVPDPLCRPVTRILEGNNNEKSDRKTKQLSIVVVDEKCIGNDVQNGTIKKDDTVSIDFQIHEQHECTKQLLDSLPPGKTNIVESNSCQTNAPCSTKKTGSKSENAVATIKEKCAPESRNVNSTKDSENMHAPHCIVNLSSLQTDKKHQSLDSLIPNNHSSYCTGGTNKHTYQSLDSLPNT